MQKFPVLESEGGITVSQSSIQGKVRHIVIGSYFNNKVQIEVSEGFLSGDQVGTESGSVSLKARDGIIVFNSVIANEGNFSLLATNAQGVIDIKPDALVAAVTRKSSDSSSGSHSVSGSWHALPDGTSFQISTVSTSISNVTFKNGAQLNGGIRIGVDDDVQPVGIVVDNPTFDLSSGQRLLIGSGDDNIAGRREKSVQIKGLQRAHSEFSFPALFLFSTVLSKYWKESGSSKTS